MNQENLVFQNEKYCIFRLISPHLSIEYLFFDLLLSCL
jgi:hypothetical protein